MIMGSNTIAYKKMESTIVLCDQVVDLAWHVCHCHCILSTALMALWSKCQPQVQEAMVQITQ